MITIHTFFTLASTTSVDTTTIRYNLSHRQPENQFNHLYRSHSFEVIVYQFAARTFADIYLWYSTATGRIQVAERHLAQHTLNSPVTDILTYLPQLLPEASLAANQFSSDYLLEHLGTDLNRA